MSPCPWHFTCEQTARPATATGSTYLLARVDAPSPAMAAYWLLARTLDVGVQLDGDGLHAVWGEMRDGDEYIKVLQTLAEGADYALELQVGDVAYCFTVRPAGVSGEAPQLCPGAAAHGRVAEQTAGGPGPGHRTR